MKSRFLKLLALLFAFTLIAAACGDDDAADDGDDMAEGDDGDDIADGDDGDDIADGDDGDDMAEGDDMADGDISITVTGPERDESEAGAIQEVLGAWGDEHGIEVTYLGSADWEAEINVQVEGGNAPDISIFPQPGKLADFARAGHVVPLNDEAAAATAANWSEAWTVFGNVDGVQYGVPVKADLKSLVWYQPARFAANGYEVPETFEDFTDLVDQIAADGETPLCVGIESGQATGWPFTDWVEDMVLRQHGPDVYDQWVAHDIPFNDERIVSTMQAVLDLWTEDNVFASSGSIAATSFQDNGQPLIDGDCFMHRQASFFSAFMPEGTSFGDGEGEVNVFYFPDINGDRPVLGAGTLAAAFNDNDATMALLAYLSTPDYAEARQVSQATRKGGGATLSGFLSAAQGQDPSVYQPLEQSFLNVLETAAIVRFDGSDLMPADVGAGTFWTEGTSFVNGDITAQEAADRIEASWP
ncbi:MAG: carbohydrate ABC transporter substrate-binding protein [Acidimicrobiaceae bacterium]|nr:carbohydrate ABC transporter substrate-binding protein [Acidimicrobiaceae bacterium]MYK00012.1 carbohydrate ABC transporter substrate-binding protein [Acidimicrobiaceae bacterium]